jgi:hypothetical protein
LRDRGPPVLHSDLVRIVKETPRPTPAPLLLNPEIASVGVGRIVRAEVRQPRSSFVPLFSYSLATKVVALFVKT